MKLKDYQERTLQVIKDYLIAIRKEQDEGNKKHASLDAWISLGKPRTYKEKQNGLGQDVPSFCLKIPTGGGKTFLAVKTIDLIQSHIRGRNTGFVLWVVPTNQIYKQTLEQLKNRNHPYRQLLDQISANKTLVLEKTDRFSVLDLKENLVVMMLMLPSASRQNKDTLRMFRDHGGFQDYFPLDDAVAEHEKLLKKFPNLDTFESEKGFWGKQIKSSLGNVLRMQAPILVIDEGHKTYSETAQETLRGFNPSIVLELSATPSEMSNVLVNIPGRDLNNEGMIKLDLHIINKSTNHWHDLLRAAYNKRLELELEARRLEANTGKYIRPICLVQVERTGKDQRDGKFIHSEDAKDFLIKTLNLRPEEVAIKTSDKDELKEVDDVGGLLSKECPIQFIITKQALQEGWDCPFAYILVILTNPGSKNALTQLVGRILRQPFAEKTGYALLDESYVYCYNQNANSLLADIRKGFGEEGLGDLTGRVILDSEITKQQQTFRDIHIRDQFKDLSKKFILPFFVMKAGGEWKTVNYERDILSTISWDELNLEPFLQIVLSEKELKDTEVKIGISENEKEIIKEKEIVTYKNGNIGLDSVFLTKQISDIVPNPWTGFEIAKNTIIGFQSKYSDNMIQNNLLFIIEELKKYLQSYLDNKAKEMYLQLLQEEKMKFMVIGNIFSLPIQQKIPDTEERLNQKNGEPLQKSLFDYVPKKDLNEEEIKVAWYLDAQEKILFWYRNIARHDYFIQGWKKGKIYPDFLIGTSHNKPVSKLDSVLVLETKGVHLKNEDTDYKKEIFDLCNEQAKEMKFSELEFKMQENSIRYELLFGDEWERKLNEIFQ